MSGLRAPVRAGQEKSETIAGGSTAVLVTRAQRGDRAAVAELYRRHVTEIYDFCAHRLGSREAAEDATQAVFVRAIGGLAGCRDPEAFRGWLFGIARHVVADTHRAGRRAAVPIDLASEVEDRTPSPERSALAVDEHARLSLARVQLTKGERELLDLLEQELTDIEIATALGKRHGAVRTAHYRLRRKLRTLLGDGEPAEEPRHVEP